MATATDILEALAAEFSISSLLPPDGLVDLLCAQNVVQDAESVTPEEVGALAMLALAEPDLTAFVDDPALITEVLAAPTVFAMIGGQEIRDMTGASTVAMFAHGLMTAFAGRTGDAPLGGRVLFGRIGDASGVEAHLDWGDRKGRVIFGDPVHSNSFGVVETREISLAAFARLADWMTGAQPSALSFGHAARALAPQSAPAGATVH